MRAILDGGFFVIIYVLIQKIFEACHIVTLSGATVGYPPDNSANADLGCFHIMEMWVDSEWFGLKPPIQLFFLIGTFTTSMNWSWNMKPWMATPCPQGFHQTQGCCLNLPCMNLSEESKFFEHLSRESITTKAGIHGIFHGATTWNLWMLGLWGDWDVGSLGRFNTCMYLQHLVFILGSWLKGFGFVGFQWWRMIQSFWIKTTKIIFLAKIFIGVKPVDVSRQGESFGSLFLVNSLHFAEIDFGDVYESVRKKQGWNS